MQLKTTHTYKMKTGVCVDTSVIFKLFIASKICLCIWGHTCHVHVEVRRHLQESDSSLLPCSGDLTHDEPDEGLLTGADLRNHLAGHS